MYSFFEIHFALENSVDPNSDILSESSATGLQRNNGLISGHLSMLQNFIDLCCHLLLLFFCCCCFQKSIFKILLQCTIGVSTSLDLDQTDKLLGLIWVQFICKC